MTTDVYGESIDESNSEDKATLAPTSKMCGDKIDLCLKRFQRNTTEMYFNISQMTKAEPAFANSVGPEHLNEHEEGGLPKHSLTLKEGAMAMFMRNMNKGKVH